MKNTDHFKETNERIADVCHLQSEVDRLTKACEQEHASVQTLTNEVKYLRGALGKINGAALPLNAFDLQDIAFRALQKTDFS